MNLANLLTYSRMILALVFWGFLFSPHPFGKLIAFCVFILASLTDYWDGMVARKMGQTSRIGKLMDPIADKVLMLAAFFGFWRLGLIPLWMAGVVIARDVIVTLPRLGMSAENPRLPATSAGKKKTAFQMFYILAVLVYLMAAQAAFWQPSWNGRAELFIRAGMIVVVAMTLWSGSKALAKK